MQQSATHCPIATVVKFKWSLQWGLYAGEENQ